MFDQLAPFGPVEGVEPDARLLSPETLASGRVHVRPFDPTYRPGYTFGLITMLDVLEHLDAPDDALQHVASLLRPGGTLVLTVPAFRSLWTRHDDLNHHRTRYRRRSLLPLVTAAGLTVESSRYLFQWTVPAKVAVRLKESLTTGPPQPPRVPPAWINRILLSYTSLEERVARLVRPPLGSSLLVIARRPEPSASHL